MNKQTIKYAAIIGLLVTFVGSQFLPSHIYPYVLFPTVIAMLFVLGQKIRIESKESALDYRRYLPLIIGVTISLGIFLYQYFRIN